MGGGGGARGTNVGAHAMVRHVGLKVHVPLVHLAIGLAISAGEGEVKPRTPYSGETWWNVSTYSASYIDYGGGGGVIQNSRGNSSQFLVQW